MKMKIYFIGAAGIIILIATWWLLSDSTKSAENIFVKPKKGSFEVSVSVQGEIQAKNSTNINGPQEVRKMGINQMKVSKIVPEGSVVKKGDFVAELEPAELVSKLKEVEINLQKFESQVTQARLDCTLTLSQARDDLVNLKYALEQRKLEKEEAIYEAPSAKRQAEIECEKAQRALEQNTANYKTKVRQAEAKMREVEADISKEKQKQEEMLIILEAFTIYAPENGMVIYAKEWGDGKKIGPGSTVSTWMPTVATLPDLSFLQSKTYVSEVDIQKVKAGQEVVIGLDADPSKKLKGKVIQVANIGEQQQGSDSKWFEVIIDIETPDASLRPSMTTSNKIIISTLDKSVFVPQECIQWEDTIPFVLKKNGSSTEKVNVKLGTSNENEVVVLSGINENDEILMSLPEESAKSEEKNKEKK